MTFALRASMTTGQFLDWEQRQGSRYEFDGSAPVAMAGGSPAHGAILANLIMALGIALRGKPCRPFGSHLKIEVAGRIRYPGAFVTCTPGDPRQTVVGTPVVVFEVLSPSTANNGLVLNNVEYRATPSVLRYVVLQQTHAGALVVSRKGEDWVSDALSGLEPVLRMPEIGIEIPMSERYADVEITGDASDP